MGNGRESIADKELRNLTSADSLGTKLSDSLGAKLATENSLLNLGIQPRRPHAEDKRTVQDDLRDTIADHQKAVADQSQLDRGLSFISEGVHGSSKSLENLERLQEKATKEGKQLSLQTELEIRRAIESDRSSMGTRSDINMYGTGMLTMAGLFLEGKKGATLTVAAYAASSAKVGDSGELQAIDAAVGAGRGLLTRGLFSAMTKVNLDVPTRALSMGAVNRFTESAISRKNYLDQNGKVDITGGLGRIVTSTADPTSAITDLVIFGGGQLGMRNQAVKNAVTRTAVTETLTAVGAFGFSAGSVEEAKRQWKTDGSLDPLAILDRGIKKGGTDMLAALPGAMLRKNSSKGWLSAPEAEVTTSGAKLSGGRSVPGVGARADVSTSPIRATSVPDVNPLKGVESSVASRISAGTKIERNFAGAQSREFQIVGGNVEALDAVARSKSAHAVIKVREVSPAGEPIGASKSMLVQHVEPGQPLKVGLAAQVDLIASCNANCLGPFTSKHIMPTVNGALGMTRVGFDRLRFSPDLESAIALGKDPVQGPALGMPPRPAPGLVSDLLRSDHTAHIMRVKRPLWAIADEMQHFKLPAKKIMDAGGDAISVELMDGRILKIHDKPSRREGEPLWDPTWGNRTVMTEQGPMRIDARMLTEPFQIEVLNNPVLYYLQERARTPVSLKSLNQFDNMLQYDGTYKFWDKDFSQHGRRQLGYVPISKGNDGLVLFDYDAVRRPADVPQGSSKSDKWGPESIMERYRGNIDWD